SYRQRERTRGTARALSLHGQGSRAAVHGIMVGMNSAETPPLPASLAEIRDDFLALPQKERLMLLLEFSQELPELPERFQNHPDLFERVIECQSPVFIATEIHDGRV